MRQEIMIMILYSNTSIESRHIIVTGILKHFRVTVLWIDYFNDISITYRMHSHNHPVNTCVSHARLAANSLCRSAPLSLQILPANLMRETHVLMRAVKGTMRRIYMY